MTEVLKALQDLNVCWKKIGHYNMKCRWVPNSSADGMLSNSMHDNNYFGDESSIIENEAAVKSPNVVKFEIQVNPLLHFMIHIGFPYDIVSDV